MTTEEMMKVRKVYTKIKGHKDEANTPKYYVVVYEECEQEHCTFCHRNWISEKAKDHYMKKHLKSGKHWRLINHYYV